MTEHDFFWLKVAPYGEVKEASRSRYAGMYVRLTGSGSRAAILTKEPPKFLCYHLDSTTQGALTITSWKHPGKQWSLRLSEQEAVAALQKDTSKTNLPGWCAVEIEEAPAEEHNFRFETAGKGEGLSSAHCKGWMVCPWTYGHPQLFYLTNAYDDAKPLPDFCERVSLVREPVQGQVPKAGP